MPLRKGIYGVPHSASRSSMMAGPRGTRRVLSRSRRGVAPAVLVAVIAVVVAGAIAGGLLATGVVKLGSPSSGGGTYPYTVTFPETGLVAGTAWSVTLNGTLHTSMSSSVQFQEPSGTYPYTVAEIPGWHASGLALSGTVVVNTTSVTEATLDFTAVTYALTFSESGLPGGTAWSVTVGGSLHSSTNASVGFLEPNGSYPYTVGTVAGYTGNLTSGTVTVSAAAKDVAVGFAPGPYSLGMSVTAWTGSGSSWWDTLALSPTAGLATGDFGIQVKNTGGTIQAAESPPTACTPYTATYTSACTGVSGGWYAALIAVNGSVVATYGSAGWTYGTGVSSIALNAGFTLVVVSAVEYFGSGYTLSVFGTGSASVSGSVYL